MSKNKSTEAQIRASLKYDKKNKEAKQYRNKKSSAKNFILKTATDVDLKEVQQWLAERLEHGIQE